MLRFSNFGSAQLASNLSATATSLRVESGKGSLFPSLTSPDTFQAVIFNVSGLFEIVTCTGRSGDVLTVVRGREGTSPRAWTTAARIELRVTAAVLDAMLQKTGGVMTGNLDMGGNSILNATLPQQSSFTDIRFATARPPTDVSTYQIGWLRSGRFSVGGPSSDDASVVITRAELRSMVFFYAGPAPIPPPWVLCNGLNGTPDLRDRFLVMAGTAYPSGSASASKLTTTMPKTSAAGAVAAARTGMTALTIAQMPAHSHTITGRQTSGNNTGNASAGTVGLSIPDLTTSSVGGGQGHDHSIPAIPNHQHDVPLPAFYALAPVMYNPSLL